MAEFAYGDWVAIKGRTDGPYRVIGNAGTMLECERLDESKFFCPATLPYKVSAPPMASEKKEQSSGKR